MIGGGVPQLVLSSYSGTSTTEEQGVASRMHTAGKRHVPPGPVAPCRIQHAVGATAGSACHADGPPCPLVLIFLAPLILICLLVVWWLA